VITQHTKTNVNLKGADGSLQHAVEQLGPWFHNLHLPDGTQTAPNSAFGDFPLNMWGFLAQHLPQDLRGWHCLDIGCNAGFYSFELARRGASVLAIDLNPRYLKQAQWAAQQFGFEQQVEFRQMQVYDLTHIPDAFDLVIFMGVLYHLRYPMLGLDIVAQKVRRLMLFQTMSMPGFDVAAPPANLHIDDREQMLAPGWPKMAFIEHQLADDPTNWWAPNHAGIEAMLRSSGMRVITRPGNEFYLCEPDREHPSCMTTWNAAEFLSATGQRLNSAAPAA
jgi:tRNA (mo5U34)-methyltransferase